MSSKLTKSVKLVHDGDEFMIFEVKKSQKMNLIIAGFYGNEVMIRVSKNNPMRCTIFYEDGTHLNLEAQECCSSGTQKMKLECFALVWDREKNI